MDEGIVTGGRPHALAVLERPPLVAVPPSVDRKLELPWFNVLNRVNYAGYVGNLSSPFYGLAVSARPARRLQASLRLNF